MPPRRAPRRSRRPQTANPPLRFSEKLPARQGRTCLRQFVCPGQPVQQKKSPVRVEPACGSSCAPLRRCRKGAAHQGRTRLRQFVCPGQPVQQKEPPVRGEPACGSSCAPVSLCREKKSTVRANTLTQFACPGQPVQKKRAAPSGRTRLRQFAYPGQPVQEKGEDAKSNGETAANFVYCYKIAQNRSVLREMTGAKC